MLDLRYLTRAEVAVLWLWARYVSPDTHVQSSPAAAVLAYPELATAPLGVN